MFQKQTDVWSFTNPAAYMSPEQAKGRPADHRADVWSFGVVLFEMLAGRNPLPGEDLTEVLASVVKVDVDWEALPSGLPAAVRRWLQRCLKGDPRQRYQAIGDVRLDIQDYLDDPEAASPALPHQAAAGLSPATVGVGLVLAVLLTALATWVLKPVPIPDTEPARQLEISIGVEASLVAPADQNPDDAETALALSPDGSTLAFVARPEGGRQQLYVRPLDRLAAAPLPGTEGANQPFFSPDGAFLGFFADGKLKKVSVSGGVVTTLCDAPLPLGGDWGEDGSIVFAEAFFSGLSRVSSAGGSPEPVTTLDSDAGENSQRWPQLLPGGRAVLYTTAAVIEWDSGHIVVQTIPHGEKKVLHRGGYHARYLPSGHLAYIRDGTLFAAPFDLERLEITGQAIPVLEDLLVSPRDGSAYFASSEKGTLVYVQGRYRRPKSTIHWLSRAGGLEPLWDSPGDYRSLRLSPDGRRLATEVRDGAEATDIWIYEPERQAQTRLTVTAVGEGSPVWSPTGESLTFSSDRGNGWGIFWKRADGSGEALPLTESPNMHSPQSWHPTGEFLAFQEVFNDTSWDIRILALEGDDPTAWTAGPIRDFLRTPFLEAFPAFSPDGRWLAYVSDESGQREVYVSPFPGPGAKYPVSIGGGLVALWSRTDDRLFYLAPGGQIMAVTYAAEGDSWQSSRPTVWSEVQVTEYFSRNFDQHPDGERFAMLLPEHVQEETERTHVILIEDFFDRLRGDVDAR